MRFWQGASLTLGLTLAACGWSGPTYGDFLQPDPPGGQTLYTIYTSPNQPLCFDIWEASWRHEKQTIHVLKVEPLGLPRQLVLDRVGAIKLDGSDNQISATSSSYDCTLDVMTATVPVNRITIPPGCLGYNPICPSWYVVAEAHLSAPGSYMSKGTRVTYEAGGHTYYQDFGTLMGASTGPRQDLPHP
jgi:hypothetical protein